MVSEQSNGTGTTFVERLWDKIKDRLAEGIVALIVLIFLSVSNLWMWRVFVVDPNIARIDESIGEAKDSIKELYGRADNSAEAARKERQRLEEQIQDVNGRLYRIEGLLGRAMKGMQ